MHDCTTYERLIVDVVNQLADEQDRSRLEQHISSCRSCRREFERARDLMETIVAAAADRPDPGPRYWEGYYHRLSNRMSNATDSANQGDPAGALNRRQGASPAGFGRGDSQSPLSTVLDRLGSWLSPRPSWAIQLAAAVVLITIGFVIGRTGTTNSPAGVARNDAAADLQYAALDERAHTYIGRSRTLLLGLVNYDLSEEAMSSLDMSRRRAAAESLVRQASTLQQDLADADRRRLSELIADLEVILLQIANLESDADLPQIEMVRSSVDQKAILFKIDIEEMRRSGLLDATSTGRGDSPDNPNPSI